MTEPRPDFSSQGVAAWVSTKTEVRLTSSAVRQVSAFCSANGTAQPFRSEVPDEGRRIDQDVEAAEGLGHLTRQPGGRPPRR